MVKRLHAHDADVVVGLVVLGGADGHGALAEDGLAGGNVAQRHQMSGRKQPQKYLILKPPVRTRLPI